jgi:hypothetical protein
MSVRLARLALWAALTAVRTVTAVAAVVLLAIELGLWALLRRSLRSP